MRSRRLARPALLAFLAVLLPAALLALYLLDTDGPQASSAEGVGSDSLAARDDLESRLANIEAVMEQPQPASEASVRARDLAEVRERLIDLEQDAATGGSGRHDLGRVDANLSAKLQHVEQRIDRLVARDAVILEVLVALVALVALNYTRETRRAYIEAATSQGLFLPWACTEVFAVFGPPDPFHFDDDTPLWCRLRKQFIR